MTLRNASSVLPDLPQGARVLILRLRSLGDLVLETPAITALHAWRPDLRIAVLAEPRFAPVFEGNPDIDEVIPAKKSLETVASLRARHFEVVFNQHGGPRSVLLTGASGAPVRVGWRGFQFSFLYNVTVPRPQEVFGRATVHTVEHRLSQFYWTGLPRGPIPRLSVVPQPAAMASVGRFLETWRIQKGEYAVLQTGAKIPAMRWPVSKFATVARWLADNFGMPSVVNLDVSDSEVASEVGQAFKGCGVVADAMNVRELIALIAGARLVVANDSGPAHLAAALQCPSVVIFSHTNPEKWKPWQAPHRIVQTGAVYDSIRGDETIVVSESRPVGAIPVEEVTSACAELLSSNASLPRD